MQHIDGVEPGFPLDIDQMLEVPTDDVRDGMGDGNGHMPGIIVILDRNHLLVHVEVGQFVGLIGQRQQIKRIKGFLEQPAHTGRSTLQFGFHQDGSAEVVKAGPPLLPQLNGCGFKFLVVIPARGGGINIEVQGFHRVHIMGKMGGRSRPQCGVCVQR